MGLRTKIPHSVCLLGTRELGAWGPAMSSVSQAACSLSWGASNGLPLLLSMCRLLGACVGQLSHQEVCS